MPKAIAHVSTESPSVNMKKLLRHFSHKIDGVQFDDHTGSVAFPFGSAHLKVQESVLEIHLDAGDEEALAQLQDVISSHLVRFAKESLTVNWEPVKA